MINPLEAVSGLPAGGKLNPFTSFGALAQRGHLINLWDVLGTREELLYGRDPQELMANFLCF